MQAVCICGRTVGLDGDFIASHQNPTHMGGPPYWEECPGSGDRVIYTCQKCGSTGPVGPCKWCIEAEETNSVKKARESLRVIEEKNPVSLKAMQTMIHSYAKGAGWWEGERDFGMLIALVHSELSEALEEFRDGREPSERYYSHRPVAKPRWWRRFFGTPEEEPAPKPEGIPSELADAVIRILDMAEHYGIDLEAVIMEKHAFNLTRGYRHGGKKA